MARMPQTTQQLKAAIDGGRTGDKVAEGFDVGLSTLGTDDEAAGTPNTPEQISLARALETRNAPRPPAEQSAQASRAVGPVAWTIAGVCMLVVVILALAVLYR
jgi:hypothetical protein